VRFTPKEAIFYDLFRDSGRHVSGAGDVLAELLAPKADRIAIAARMRDLEHSADTVTHRIMQQLNKSFVTPFDREDIYRLASNLDDVIDTLEEATDFLALADVGPFLPLMNDQINVVQRATTETAQAMGRLQTLQDLEPYWIEVNRLENEADQIYRKLIAKLYSGEYDVLRMLKLREVADKFEEAADALEHVAHVVETIAVKES
jgi:predicted phosphate transport protein (TIGR00153 family)